MELTMVEVLQGPDFFSRSDKQKERGVKVHSAGVHIEHKMTAVQRKAWFFMLYNAVQAPEDQDVYSVQIKDLAEAIGCQSTNLKRIKDSLEKMVGITVKWDIFGKVKEHDTSEQNIWGISALLADCEVFPHSGTCEYSFSTKLKRRFLKPSMFVKLNLLVTRRFTSKNSLALYCMALDYLIIAKNHGQKTLSVAEIRQLLGLPEDKYERVVDLHKHVLKKAVQDINKKSDMQMILTPKKTGRKITDFHIEMSIKPENLDFYRKNKLAFERAEAPFQLDDITQNAKDPLTTKLAEDSELHAFLTQYRINRTTAQIQEVEKRVQMLLGEEYVEKFLRFVMEYVQAEQAERQKAGKEPIKSISGFYVNQLQQDTHLQSFLLQKNQNDERDRIKEEERKSKNEAIEQEFDKTLLHFYQKYRLSQAKSYFEEHFSDHMEAIVQIFEGLNSFQKNVITRRYGNQVTLEYLEDTMLMMSLLDLHQEIASQGVPSYDEWKHGYIAENKEQAEKMRHEAALAVQ